MQRSNRTGWTTAMATMLLALGLCIPVGAVAADGGFIHREGNKTLPDLFTAELAAAKKQNKQVVVMFTADWCTPCKIIKNYLHESAEVKRLTRKGIIKLIDVDEWRGPAHRLIPGINPTKLPTLVRVDYAGKAVQTCYGTDLGLLSGKSVGQNLARLIDGKAPETPYYEKDPALKRKLVLEQAKQTKARHQGEKPVTVSVIEKKATRSGMAKWRLRITIRNPGAPRRWFAISRIGGTLSETPQIDSWELLKFDEHVRSGVSRYYGAPGFSLMPIAGHGGVDLVGWTEEAPANATSITIWELRSYSQDGKQAQFQKKVPYELNIERAGDLKSIRRWEGQPDIQMPALKKHVVPLK